MFVFMIAKRWLMVVFVVCLAALVGGCGNVGMGRVVLSNVAVQPTTLHPTGAGESLDIHYTIGCDATLSVWFEDASGNRYQVRDEEPRHVMSTAYVLRFDGTVPTNDPTVLRRLLPSGNYDVIVRAHSTACGTKEVRLPITMTGTDGVLPNIEQMLAMPHTISPNADAIDDIAEITYRLPVTATVDINITTPTQHIIPFVTREEQYPAEWHYVWNGKRPDGALLPNGIYTYTITAEDRFGNIVQQHDTIELVDVGMPEATITYASIAPRQVMLGNVVTITMRVKNTGDVPIRTYGPPSGYTYTTDDVYSSVDNGAYTAHAGGFWRIGADWDANSGGGARRYPFRWALSSRPPNEWKIPGEEDWLMPGEEVEVIGTVVIQQRETRMGFYVGLIQDGVGFYQDRTARTIVDVGF